MGAGKERPESERKGRETGEWRGCCSNLVVCWRDDMRLRTRIALFNLSQLLVSFKHNFIFLNQHICFNDFHKHINYNLQSLQYFFWYFIKCYCERPFMKWMIQLLIFWTLKCVPLSFLFQGIWNNKETKLNTWKSETSVLLSAWQVALLTSKNDKLIVSRVYK